MLVLADWLLVAAFLTVTGSYYLGVFLSTAAYIHPGLRSGGRDLVQDSFTVIGTLFIFDLIVYTATLIAPSIDPLYSQLERTCENALQTGNAIQMLGIGAAVAIGVAVIAINVMKLSWLSLLVIRKILSDAAAFAGMEASFWSSFSYMAGIVTMMNSGFMVFASFIRSNWLLLAAIGVFIRILPFNIGERAGRGLVAFSTLNYLLLPFYPTFRDVFTLFLREGYPLAAYFPANYVLLDGVFLGFYIGFIMWLVGGVSLVSFGLEGLIPALGATAVVAWTRKLAQKGVEFMQQVGELAAEKAEEVTQIRGELLQTVAGVASEVLALPYGNEEAKQVLLGRLEELEGKIKGLSPVELLSRRDELQREIEFELQGIKRDIDMIFFESPVTREDMGAREQFEEDLSGLLRDVTEPQPVTPPTLDMRQLMNQYEEGLQGWMGEALGHPQTVAARVGEASFITREGMEPDALGFASVFERLVPETHRSFVDKVFVTDHVRWRPDVGGRVAGEAWSYDVGRPDGKTDIILYKDATERALLHEVGHAVEYSFTTREQAEWDPIHRELSRGYPAGDYRSGREEETFADAYVKYASNERLPDNVKSFFDQHVTNRRYAPQR